MIEICSAPAARRVVPESLPAPQACVAGYHSKEFQESHFLEEPHRIETIQEETVGRYVNILLDKWFRNVFIVEDNKDIILQMVQQLIPERNIVSISYDDVKWKHSPVLEGHDAIFDLNAVSADGTRFVIELQRGEQANFMARALFYSTFPIQQQVKAVHKKRLKNAKQYIPSHDEQFNYMPVYIISFLNFSMHDGEERVLYRYDLRERVSGDMLMDNLHFIFLEMTHFQREPALQDSFAEKLAYAFTHMGSLEERPRALQEEFFRKFFEACEVTKLNKQQHEEYITDMTTAMDLENQFYTVEMRGEKRGINKVAKNLYALNIPIETIAKAAGLSEEEIRKLME